MALNGQLRFFYPSIPQRDKNTDVMQSLTPHPDETCPITSFLRPCPGSSDPTFPWQILKRKLHREQNCEWKIKEQPFSAKGSTWPWPAEESLCPTGTISPLVCFFEVLFSRGFPHGFGGALWLWTAKGKVRENWISSCRE